MFDYLFIGIVVTMFLFLAFVIIKANRKQKFEIRYIRGWFVVQDRKSQFHLARFKKINLAENWIKDNSDEKAL